MKEHSDIELSRKTGYNDNSFKQNLSYQNQQIIDTIQMKRL